MTRDTSGVVLILANLVPLAGVLFWDWGIFNVVVLYWLENVIIGVINILKMFTCAPDMQALANKADELTGKRPEQAEKLRDLIKNHGNKAALLNHGAKFFFIPFFTVHYGIFCLVHGMFVFVLLGGSAGNGGIICGGPPPDGFTELVRGALDAGGIWAALALVASHLFSFFHNYLGKGEYRRTAVPLLMAAPYGRVVVLHIAILFGAFATIMLGSPVFLLLLLIGGKIVLDLKFHRRSHRKLSS
ncbi:MAG TPA: DUF6498-containing protein [Luteolibacter sp.]|nr:DUF6498-containing protein [Luteolibacter sp.]